MKNCEENKTLDSPYLYENFYHVYIISQVIIQEIGNQCLGANHLIPLGSMVFLCYQTFLNPKLTHAAFF